MRSLAPLRFAVVAALVAIAVPPLAAQVAIVEEGIFTLSVNGERSGREDFSIRRNLADGTVTAQGNVLRGESRVSVVLTVDSTGLPLKFIYERFAAGRRLESTTGEYRRGLWSGRMVVPDRESGREFRLPDAVLASDDEVVHHAWFLLRFAAKGPAQVLRPREWAMRPVVVESAGADSVMFGLDAYDATRWIVRDGPGGAVLRELWADAQGRLLRVRLPGTNVEATRDEPPPETPPPAGAYEGTDPLPYRNRY